VTAAESGDHIFLARRGSAATPGFQVGRAALFRLDLRLPCLDTELSELSDESLDILRAPQGNRTLVSTSAIPAFSRRGTAGAA
jgi:hypothetical protein